MAQTFQAVFRSEGDDIDYTPGSAVAAGDVIVQNSVVGIATSDIAASTLGKLRVTGAARMVKINGAITAGSAVYWDANGDPQGGTAGTGALTTTASGNTFVGYAILAAAETAEYVEVLLVQAKGISFYGPISNAIADPGDAGAIPVTQSGYVPIVTGGSETRTLAAPSFIGQELVLYIKTDGGTCVVTVASAINQTGNNTITMADVRDAIHLRAIESGSNKVWDVVVANGAALSTV